MPRASSSPYRFLDFSDFLGRSQKNDESHQVPSREASVWQSDCSWYSHLMSWKIRISQLWCPKWNLFMYSCLFDFCLTRIRSAQFWFTAKLSILWREWLTRNFIDGYMSHRAYYVTRPERLVKIWCCLSVSPCFLDPPQDLCPSPTFFCHMSPYKSHINHIICSICSCFLTLDDVDVLLSFDPYPRTSTPTMKQTPKWTILTSGCRRCAKLCVGEKKSRRWQSNMGLSENVGYIPNEIAIFHRDNDQQNHWV